MAPDTETVIDYSTNTKACAMQAFKLYIKCGCVIPQGQKSMYTQSNQKWPPVLGLVDL